MEQEHPLIPWCPCMFSLSWISLKCASEETERAIGNGQVESCWSVRCQFFCRHIPVKGFKSYACMIRREREREMNKMEGRRRTRISTPHLCICKIKQWRTHNASGWHRCMLSGVMEDGGRFFTHTHTSFEAILLSARVKTERKRWINETSVPAYAMKASNIWMWIGKDDAFVSVIHHLSAIHI